MNLSESADADVVIELIRRFEALETVHATRPEIEDVRGLMTGDTSTPLDQVDLIVQTERSLDALIDLANVPSIQSIEFRVPREPETPAVAVHRYDHSIGAAPDAAVPATDDLVVEDSVDDDSGLAVEVETRITPPQTTPPPNNPPRAAPAKASPADNGGEGSTATRTPRKTSSSTMRVDIERLDELMSLAGELVINQAQFAQVTEDIESDARRGGPDARATIETLRHSLTDLRSMIDNGDSSSVAATVEQLGSSLESLADQAGTWDRNRRALGKLDDAVDRLGRVSKSMQQGVLGTRMVPVGPLMNRFRRVVRDLSSSRNKRIELVLRGEQTEMDKRMVDEIGDPLVHLVRNSIDHGLETEAERIAAGKPAVGTLTLSAGHVANHIRIQISDDGRGIDASKIRERLRSRSLVPATRLQSMTDDELVSCIFMPGFSTAETVTDISGRGVGMDVVRAKIAELNGSIDIKTERGIGTTFTLKLPLTLAIVGSLLVEIGGLTFAIPKDDIHEIISLTGDQIHRMGGGEAFENRGEYRPLLRLQSVFGWHGAAAARVATPDRDNDRGNDRRSRRQEIAILHSGGGLIGLVVDRLIGARDVVIKSLSDNFVNVPGLAGATILGDGSVALLLDSGVLKGLAARGGGNVVAGDPNAHPSDSQPADGFGSSAAGPNDSSVIGTGSL